MRILFWRKPKPKQYEYDPFKSKQKVEQRYVFAPIGTGPPRLIPITPFRPDLGPGRPRNPSETYLK